jgi:membrane-bound metal-dependent hydrolase YbcI (DUF457 family)
MLLGHFGIAAGVRAKERKMPLWSLMVATQWLGILFVPLLALGIETIDDAPGTGGGYGNAIIHADYTHSLVGAMLLCRLFGLFFTRRWNRRAGMVLGGVAFSHWLLDLVAHRQDVPLLPGNASRFSRLGLGLWESPGVSVTVEVTLLVVGCALYWRAARETLPGSNASVTRRATLITGGMLIAGLVTIGLDLAGL